MTDTRTIYQRKGYSNRRDYLESLADDYGLDPDSVFMAADLLGPNEDFDGLISTLDDLGYMF